MVFFPGNSILPLLWGLGNPFALGPFSVQSVHPGREEGESGPPDPGWSPSIKSSFSLQSLSSPELWNSFPTEMALNAMGQCLIAMVTLEIPLLSNSI